MTKEELEKEAEEKAGIYFDSLDYDHGNVSDTPFSSYDVYAAYEKGAMDFVEPREKQIQIDAEQIRALQKQNGELTDELKALRESIKDYGARCYENGLRNGRRKLEAQIEKMKCCEICSHNRGGCSYHHNWTKDCLENNHKYFELRR